MGGHSLEPRISDQVIRSPGWAHAGRLQSGRLQSRATDSESGYPLTWLGVLGEATLGEVTAPGHRFRTWSSAHLAGCILGGDILGRYNLGPRIVWTSARPSLECHWCHTPLGGYSLAPRVSDPGSNSTNSGSRMGPTFLDATISRHGLRIWTSANPPLGYQRGP